MLRWEPWEPRVWTGPQASRKNGPWKVEQGTLLGGCEVIQGETWWLGPEYSSRGGRMARLGIYLEVELRGLAARLDRGWGGGRGCTEVFG